MFDNNIFFNPKGWADAVVGRKSNYIAMICLTIAASLLIFVFLFVIAGDIFGIGFYFFMLFFVLLAPLSYLRVLRFLYKEIEKNNV